MSAAVGASVPRYETCRCLGCAVICWTSYDSKEGWVISAYFLKSIATNKSRRKVTEKRKWQSSRQ